MFTVKAKNFIPRLVIVLLLVFNFVTYSRLAGSTDKAKITYIDLGNSNSSHIKMPGGTNILINSGNSTDRFFTSERYIIPYLKNEGVSSIEILLVNSMNYSEYRNLAYFVSHFPVRKVIMPVCYKPIFDRSFAFAKVNVDYMSKSTIINKQGNFRIYIYYYPNLAGESMMTEFVYGEQSFMFNDSYNTEDDVINTSCLPDENVLMVLKASGSGSFNFNSAEFIAKSDPEFVVISSSDRGRKRVESEIFAKSLDESGYTVMKTSEEGAIIFETDGYVTGRVYWK